RCPTCENVFSHEQPRCPRCGAPSPWGAPLTPASRYSTPSQPGTRVTWLRIGHAFVVAVAAGDLSCLLDAASVIPYMSTGNHRLAMRVSGPLFASFGLAFFWQSPSKHWLRSALIGAAVGIVGGVLGVSFGWLNDFTALFVAPSWIGGGTTAFFLTLSAYSK